TCGSTRHHGVSFRKTLVSRCLSSSRLSFFVVIFFFQAEDGIRDGHVTGVQTCALPISGDDYAWTETVMREAGRMIDGIDLHNYTVARTWASKGRATEFTEEDWFSAVQKALRMDTLITRHSTIMDRYDPARRVWLIVGEW